MPRRPVDLPHAAATSTRIDLLARAMGSGAPKATRRGLLWGLAGLVGLANPTGGGPLTAAGFPTRPMADTTDGCLPTPGSVVTTTTTTTATTAIAAAAPRGATIFRGTCLEDGGESAFALLPLGSGRATAGTPTANAADLAGLPSAIPGQLSVTLVDTTLDGLLGTPHGVRILSDESAEATVIACGDIGGRPGGQTTDEDLVFGIRERNGSGYAGVAWLRGDANRTLVHLLLAPGLHGGGIGTPLRVTEDDVNLRAGPSTDAAVVATLALDAPLTATGPEADGWIPVTDPTTGTAGYVLADFVRAG